MSALHFRIDRHAFRGARHAPRHRRHPLLRIAAGLLGLAVLAVMVFASVFLGAAMLAGGLVYRLWKRRGQPAPRPSRVVEGEYHVVGKPT
jgi:hypothetical protein